MTPVQALSQLRSNVLSPTRAWECACAHLHESIGWSAVLAHALKAQPTLHAELFAILSAVTPGDDASVKKAFENLTVWASTQDIQKLGPALAIWVAQTQIDQCTVAELIKATPLSWRWDMAVAIMPEENIRADHKILIHVLWMSKMQHDQSIDQQVDPSILSTALAP